MGEEEPETVAVAIWSMKMQVHLALIVESVCVHTSDLHSPVRVRIDDALGTPTVPPCTREYSGSKVDN